MRLIPRHRHSRRPKGARIAISEAEISADLHYPASRGASRRESAGRRPGAKWARTEWTATSCSPTASPPACCWG